MLNHDLINIEALKLREQRNYLGELKNGIKQLTTKPNLANYIIEKINSGVKHISKKNGIKLDSNEPLKLDNSIYVLKDEYGSAHAFMLGQLLGETNKSVVKYAYDLMTGEEVAFKRVVEGQNVEKRAKDCIDRENRRERNALIHFGYFCGNDVIQSANNEKYCLASKLIPGRNVDKILISVNKRVKDEDELEENFITLIKIAFQFCLTVHQFHENGSIHRDIKPANMMMSKDEFGEKMELIDFGGFVKVNEIDEDEDFDYGTDEYRAPEVSNVVRHSPASDAYSVGKSLQEILEILNAVAFMKYFYPFERIAFKEIKEKLGAIVAGLTQKDPKERLTLVQALNAFNEMAQIDPEIFSINGKVLDNLSKLKI